MQATTIPDPYSEYKSLSDEELHRRFQASGDSLACEVLNRNHFARLTREVEAKYRGTVFAMSDLDFEDIANRALMQALMYPSMDAREGAFKNLLSKIAHDRVVDALRIWNGKRRGGSLAHVYIDATNSQNDGENGRQIEIRDVSPDPAEIVYSQQLRVAIEHCESCLTDRELSVWKEWKEKERGENFESIGVILGITSANARVLTVRARRKMERCLKDKGLSPERRVKHV